MKIRLPLLARFPGRSLPPGGLTVLGIGKPGVDALYFTRQGLEGFGAEVLG